MCRRQVVSAHDTELRLRAEGLLQDAVVPTKPVFHSRQGNETGPQLLQPRLCELLQAGALGVLNLRKIFNFATRRPIGPHV